MSTRKEVQGLRGAATDEHTGSKGKIYSSFVSLVEVRDDSPSTHDPARGFIVLDLGTGSTLEIVDASGSTVTIDATTLVGAFVPLAVWQITTNTDIASVLCIF